MVGMGALPRLVDGIKPRPRPRCISDARSVRKCPSYVGCYSLGLRWGWPALDCGACPVRELIPQRRSAA